MLFSGLHTPRLRTCKQTKSTSSAWRRRTCMVEVSPVSRLVSLRQRRRLPLDVVLDCMMNLVEGLGANMMDPRSITMTNSVSCHAHWSIIEITRVNCLWWLKCLWWNRIQVCLWLCFYLLCKVTNYEIFILSDWDIWSKYKPQPVDIKSGSVYDNYDVYEELGT